MTQKLKEKRDLFIESRYSDDLWPKYGELYRIVAKESWNDCANLLLPEIKNLEKAIQHCEKFDTSGHMGRYGYGEVIRGHRPEPGTRFKTPKEKAREVLQSLRDFLGEESEENNDSKN